MDRPEKLVEVVGQQRLADKVTSILDRIEMELDEADSNIGQAMHLVDLDNDGLVRPLLLRAFVCMGYYSHRAMSRLG